MASYSQVLNMGRGQPMLQAPGVPTARPSTPTGGPPPLLGQALAGMNPGQPRFAPPQLRPGPPAGPPPGMAPPIPGSPPMGPPGPPGAGQPPNPLDELAKQLEGPEIANLFGPQGMPALSLMDLMRLMQMSHSWNDASAPYGAIL